MKFLDLAKVGQPYFLTGVEAQRLASRTGVALAERHADAEAISTFVYSDLGRDVLQRHGKDHHAEGQGQHGEIDLVQAHAEEADQQRQPVDVEGERDAERRLEERAERALAAEEDEEAVADRHGREHEREVHEAVEEAAARGLDGPRVVQVIAVIIHRPFRR